LLFAIRSGIRLRQHGPALRQNCLYLAYFRVPGLNNVQARGDPEAKLVIVPYERFKKAPANGNDTPDSILVLWLKEDALMSRPLMTLSSLVRLLKDTNIKIIGPFSSDMLHAMVTEALALEDHSCGAAASLWPLLQNVKFYAYGASAPDDYLFHCGSLQNYFANHGIDLQRTIATDDTLADGILNELLLRRVNPRPIRKDDPTFDHEDHIALISEWDTFYGQTLPKAVARRFAPDNPEPNWIHTFIYLRGLDGVLPSSAGKEETKQDKPTTPGEKQAGASDFFKIEKDTQTERPIGESQYDYLRRISGHLHNTDSGLRKQTDKEGNEKKIKAIGILVGDVFDKLLILRALRP
jgi:hypothetical protein